MRDVRITGRRWGEMGKRNLLRLNPNCANIVELIFFKRDPVNARSKLRLHWEHVGSYMRHGFLDLNYKEATAKAKLGTLFKRGETVSNAI